MFYEVFIPSAGKDGFDVTITVEADNWMTALKSGLSRTGEGEDSVRNVMCDIKEDNTIHVTDATTRRVFVLKEVAQPEVAREEESFTTMKLKVPNFDDVPESEPQVPRAKPLVTKIPAPGERRTTAPMDSTDSPRTAAPANRVPTKPQHEPAKPSERVSTLRQHEPIRISDEPTERMHVPVAPNDGSREEPSKIASDSTPHVERHDPEVPTERMHQPVADVNPRKTEPPKSVVNGAPPPRPSVEVRPERRHQVDDAPQPSIVVAREPQPSVVIAEDPQPSVVIEGEQDVVDTGSAGVPPQTAIASGSHGQSETEEDAAWRGIGSSSFEALRRDEPSPKVVREERIPTGQRESIDIGRRDESVSDNIIEEVFLEISRIHDGEMSMEDVVNYVMDLALEKITAESGSIMFADVNGKELYFATARGPKAHEVMNFRVPMGKGIVGFCAREGVSLAISDVENDPRFYRAISEAIGYDTKSLCCAPIQFEGRVYGAIELLNKEGRHFSGTEVNALTYIGRQLARYVHDLIMSRERLD